MIMPKKFTLKVLTEMVELGMAIDITNTITPNQIPEPYTVVGYANGLYGVTAKLYKGADGKFYTVLRPNSNLYRY